MSYARWRSIRFEEPVELFKKKKENFHPACATTILREPIKYLCFDNGTFSFQRNSIFLSSRTFDVLFNSVIDLSFCFLILPKFVLE